MRLHRFEVEARYPEQVEHASVDQLVTVDPHYQSICRGKLEGWSPDKVVAIPNWVDVDQLDRPKYRGARFNLGMIGIAPKRKRLDLALDILREVRREDERFTLHIKTKMPWEYWWIWQNQAEQAHYREALQRIQTDELLFGAVTFDPFGRDVATWLRKIGCVLSTSDDESFHLSPAEGMASGAPSVVLPWPGSADVYGEPWVVPDVSAAVERILTQADADVWTDRANMARESIRPYALQTVVQSWVKLLTKDRQPSTWP